MKPKKSPPDAAAAARRQRAEAVFHERATPATPEQGGEQTEEAARRMLHELQVHQIELEMQNEELRRAQEELEVANARYFDFYDRAPACYCTISEAGLIREANLILANRLGVNRGALVNQPFSLFLHPEDGDIFRRLRQQLLATGRPQTCELRLGPPGGPPGWFQLAATAITEAGGAAELRVVLSDLTERKQAEEVLRASEERYHSLHTAMGEGMALHELVCDAAGQPVDYVLLDMNPAFETLTGLRRAAVLGHRASEVYGGEVPMLEVYAEVATTGRPATFETTYEPMQKTFAISVFSPAKGRFATVFADITEHKRAAAELAASEKRHRAIIDASPVPLAVNDGQQHITYLNRAFGSVFGYTQDDIPTLADWWPKAYPDPQYRKIITDAWQARLEQAQRTGKPFEPLEAEIRCKDGTRRTILACMAPLSEGDNEGEHLAVLYDITERKQAEEKLRESDWRFRDLLKNIASVAVQSYGYDGTTHYWNTASEKIYGYTAAEAIGRNLLDLIIPPAMAPGVRQAIRQMAETGQAIPASELTLRRKDGSRVAVFSSHAIVQSPGQPPELFCIDVDLTELKRAEESHARLAMAVEQAAETIMITDASGTIIYTNPAFEKTSGYSRAEVRGQNPRVLKSGQQDATFYRQLWETIQHGEVWSGHFVNKRKDGGLYDEEATISPIRDAHGRIINFVAVKRDVTREKELENQVRQSQKMEAIGTLAGGIAHDFNNVLAVILGYASLVKEDLEKGPARLEDVEEILKAATRAQELVQQILTFSRQREQSRRIIPLDTVVKEATKFLRASLPAEIAFEIQLAADAPAVLANATQIYQVTVNLATNALHAMEGRPGQLTVRLESFRPDDTFIRQHPQLKPMQYARLTVADTGHGMDARTLKRIYEPFFTTKPVGKGTGLGLSVVHGIVQAHDGLITVESEVGTGTTFGLYFPAVKADEGLLKKDQRAVLQGQGQKILVVDDETALAAVMQKVLERVNYEATIATRPQAALELVRAQPAQFDLVVTDLTMPQMNGVELAKQLRAIRPDLPILLATGNIAELDPATLGAAGICELLEKPVRTDALAKAVHAALAKTGTPKTEV